MENVDMSLVYNISLCRICQIPDHLSLENTSVTTKNGQTLLDILKFIFNDIFGVEDKLPSVICKTCIMRVLDTSKFKKMCLESNDRRNAVYIDNVKFKMEKNSIHEIEDRKIYDFGKYDINGSREEVKEAFKDNVECRNVNTKTKIKRKIAAKENIVQDELKMKRIKKLVQGNIQLQNQKDIIESVESAQKIEEFKKEKGYVCEFCPTSFSSIDKFDRHVYKHNGIRNYACDDCNAKYITKADLKAHSRLRCIESKSPCPLCPSKKFSPQLLVTHMKIVHLNGVDEEEKKSKDRSDGDIENKNDNALQSNIDSGKDLDEIVKSGRNNVKRSRERLNGTVFTCHICPREFSRSMYLDQHVYKHDGTRNHTCKDCGAKFITVSDLSNHKRIVHIEKEDYKFLCTECGSKFPLSSGLKMHVLRHHTNNRNFTCVICDKSFYEKRDLHNHMTSHTKRREFKCDLCSAEYKHRNVLLVHKTKAHGIGNYKRKMPDKYKCPYCLKIISSKAKLPRHIRTHTGVKPFKCRLCDVKFSCKSYVKGHVKGKHNVDVDASDYCSYLYYELCGEDGDPVEENGGIPVNSEEEDEEQIV